jgi:molybdopterin/thiamine biosynthesis adenylyltransferase
MRQGTRYNLFLAHQPGRLSSVDLMREEVFLYPISNRNGSQAAPRVLIVGLGALGCPAAETLADSGCVDLTLVDDDRVELSNLQRQTLFHRQDAERATPKALAAEQALSGHGRTRRFEGIVDRVTAKNVAHLVSENDFVIDACDNPATKLLLNRACVAAGTPLAYGGVVRTGGQTMTIIPGRSACLECAFPALAEDAETDDGDSCSRMGILAPVAGVIGSLQAVAALETLSGRSDGGEMQIYDLTATHWRTIRFERDPACETCGQVASATDSDTARRLPTCPM